VALSLRIPPLAAFSVGEFGAKLGSFFVELALIALPEGKIIRGVKGRVERVLGAAVNAGRVGIVGQALGNPAVYESQLELQHHRMDRRRMAHRNRFRCAFKGFGHGCSSCCECLHKVAVAPPRERRKGCVVMTPLSIRAIRRAATGFVAHRGNAKGALQ
jgi:hypothetical protein